VRLEVRGELQNANCTTTLRAVPEIANWKASAINNLHFAICNLQSPTLFAGRQSQVRVLRLRSGRPDQRVMLVIDDATYTVREVTSQHDAHPLSVVAELADPASRSKSARA
jgi:hypothetical protein